MDALHSDRPLEAQLATARILLAQYAVQLDEYDGMNREQRRTERGKELASRIVGLRAGLRKWMERAAELENAIAAEAARVAEHAEHVTVSTAYPEDCLEGECDHRDEDGEPEDMTACTPVPPFEVCVDCMDLAGCGRDPECWDDVPLIAWPHTEEQHTDRENEGHEE